MNNAKPALIVLVIIVILAFGLYSCVKKGTNAVVPSTDTGPKEINNYQGQDLSKIADFRENSIAGPQTVNIATYRLAVTNKVKTTLSLTYQDVISKFGTRQKVVTLNCVEGWSVTILWEGVPVAAIIDLAQPSADAKIVIFHAEDGYTTSFPLSYIRDNNIIMAYKMNGLDLPKERGFPFQLVAEAKWGYKWIKWITAIELSSDVNYKGYWESRGYSNGGDLDKPMFSSED